MQQAQYPRFSERCFLLSPLYAYSGWYFRVRGGKSRGPFYRKEEALHAAHQYASECAGRGDMGGRLQPLAAMESELRAARPQ